MSSSTHGGNASHGYYLCSYWVCSSEFTLYSLSSSDDSEALCQSKKSRMWEEGAEMLGKVETESGQNHPKGSLMGRDPEATMSMES